MPRPPTPKQIVGLTAFLLSIAFSALVVADHAGYVSVLDAEYRRDGFCVADHATHGFNSFQMCFIVDTLACVILLSMKRARGPFIVHTATIFFHGAYHFLQYLFGLPLPRTLHLAAYTIFTLAYMFEFGIGVKVGSKGTLALVTLAIVCVDYYLVPHPMSFAYTNGWIFATATISGMVTPPEKRDCYGASWPATLTLLLGGAVFPFCEAMLCNRGVKALGGHAIFDAFLAAVTLISVASADDRSATKSKSS